MTASSPPALTCWLQCQTAASAAEAAAPHRPGEPTALVASRTDIMLNDSRSAPAVCQCNKSNMPAAGAKLLEGHSQLCCRPPRCRPRSAGLASSAGAPQRAPGPWSAGPTQLAQLWPPSGRVASADGPRMEMAGPRSQLPPAAEREAALRLKGASIVEPVRFAM